MGFRSPRVIVVKPDDKQNVWKLIAGPDDSGASANLYQDTNIHASKLRAGESLGYTLQRNRHAWLQVTTGEITVNGTNHIQRLESKPAYWMPVNSAHSFFQLVMSSLLNWCRWL